jgi:putative ABC transport system ATP-binding protein
MDLLRQVVHSQGKTLLVVTHDSRIFPYADRIVRLNDGAVTGEMEAAAPNQAA